MFDRQILLDPLEERFDLPTFAIDLGDDLRGQIEAIGQKDKELVGFGIAIGDATQSIRVGKFGFWRGKKNALVAAQPGGFVDLARGGPGVAHIVLGTNDKGDLALMQRLKSGEIQIAAIDNDDRTGWPLNQVQYIDVVHFASRDIDENRNRAAQIDDRVGFDCRLGGSKIRPRKQRQTQIDGRRVQRIEWFVQSQPNVLALMQLDRYGNQSMTQCLEQPPVAPFVGIGQGGTRYLAANPNVVELGTVRVQTRHQIAQALASGDLGIRDTQEMVPGREMPDAMIRAEAIHQMLEVTEGYKGQQLCENRLTAIHFYASIAKKTGNHRRQKPCAISNRRNRQSCQNPRHYWITAK